MNQSRNIKWISLAVANLLVLILCLFLITYNMPYHSGDGPGGFNIFWDYCAYARNIDVELVTDWHSPLLLYEGIVVKNVASLFGITLSGMQCLNVMTTVWVIVLMLSISCISSVGCIKNYWGFALFPLIIFIIIRFNGGQHNWGLDQIFLCALFAMLACILTLYSIKRKWVKIILVSVILVLLWHCCSFRKNSILIIPFIMGALCFSSQRYRNISFKKFSGLGLIFSVCFFLLITLVSHFFIPALKSYPLSPMFLSDIRIAHILNGTQDDFLSDPMLVKRPTGQKVNGATDYEIGAGTHEYYDRENCDICKKGLGVMHSSRKVYNMYYQSWGKMPEEMLIAKLIQLAQFYRIDGALAPLKLKLENAYPALKDSRVSWLQKDNSSWIRNVWGTFIPMFVIIALALKKIAKRDSSFSSFDFFIILLGCIAMSYFFSYIIVTPTTDYRYIMPSVCLGQMVILIWMLRFAHRLWPLICKRVVR